MRRPRRCTSARSRRPARAGTAAWRRIRASRRAGVRFLIDPEIDAEELASEAQAAIETLEREGDRRGLAEAWRLIGEVRLSQGRAGDGRQALEQALAHVSREVAPRTWNAVLFEIGTCLIDGPAPLDEAVVFARDRLDAARAAGAARRGGGHAARTGRRPGTMRRLRSGPPALEESSRISDELGLRYMAQWSKRNLGHLELAAGDPAAAERVLRDSWDVLVEMGLNSSLGETAVPLAEALHAQGRDGDANETLKAVKDEWASGDASIAAPRLAVRARLQAADGFTRVALQTAERGLRVVRRTDLLCLQADMLLAHAEVARLAGEYDAGAESAAEALRISEEKGYAVGSARARMETAQA